MSSPLVYFGRFGNQGQEVAFLGLSVTPLTGGVTGKVASRLCVVGEATLFRSVFSEKTNIIDRVGPRALGL